MSRSLRTRRPLLQAWALETRLVPAADVLEFHGDFGSIGVNATETELSPGNLNVETFGKRFAVGFDGQAYAQPLVKRAVTIADGPNTTAGAAGVHDVVFAATQHNSVYAIDAGTGAVLWKRSFLDPTVPANNHLGASSITPVPSADTGSKDIDPEVGITGTPVIDPTTNTLFVVAKTKAMVGTTAHYVQRLHALSLSDGTDRVAPFLLGDSVLPNVNTTPIYVYGSGDGAVTDPYHGTGRPVVQFHALRGNQRPALNLVNGNVYIAWASHGDTGPYHGWVVKIDVSDLATRGMVLAGVFNTSPNDSASGIWQSAGKLAFEPDGSAFYFETGNGSGGAPVLNAAGFPQDGNYNEAVVKVVNDPTTSPTSQNINGWGLKATDFFIPYNVVALDSADSDFGAGAPILLPDSAGIPGHPRLMVVGGKEGKLYVLDRDNLGGFDAQHDRALNSVPNGSGHNTPPKVLAGLFSTPVWHNGRLYAVSGLGGRAYAFSLGADGHLTAVSQTAVSTFGGLMGSPTVSANGATDGIVWIPDRATNRLRAFDAATLATELWNSDQGAGGRDALGAVVKFAVPTVANGQAFVGTMSQLVGYGAFAAASGAPDAPVLSATALSGTSIALTWTDPTPAGNRATSYAIERSTDGSTFAVVTTAPAGATTVTVGGLEPLTRYYFRVRGINATGSSDPSNVADATTGDQVPLIDYGSGFTVGGLAVNGSARLDGGRLELTAGVHNAGTAFYPSPVDVTGFTTHFSFRLTDAVADGLTFAIQGKGPNTVGVGGGYLGYGGIPNSVAVKFDLFDNAGEGHNSTGLYTGGADPMSVGSIDLGLSDINLHGGDVFRADLTYDGATLGVRITDLDTGVTAAQSYSVDIPALVGGPTGYVGFTGGTGTLTAVQDILTWVYTPDAPFSPNAPSGLGAVPASATSVHLTWTANSTTPTGYYLDRAIDPDFTGGLVRQTLPAAPNSFTDAATGLAPGNTYYYRLQAFNGTGVSDYTNVAAASIPVAPPTPSLQQVEDVTATGIELSWQDNAGHQADGYRILRSENRGLFTEVATLPPTSRTPPSIYEWADENLTPGTYYEYHVVAYNVSGSIDFAGINATTVTNPPTALMATAGTGVMRLTWAAPAGAQTFNVYRGTSPGAPAATPIATGLTTPAFDDTLAVPGTTYYYTVTAVNANADRQPPIPSESEPSPEVTGGVAAATTGELSFNGAARQIGGDIRLTSGTPFHQAGSAFTTAPVTVADFRTAFEFQLTGAQGDGFAFVIQGAGPGAIGMSGEGLGYFGIDRSIAVKFDLCNNAGEGANSTGLFLNGAMPSGPGSVSLDETGINLHHGRPIRAELDYTGGTLAVRLTDLMTGATATQSYTVDIAGTVGGEAAYVGFTGGTGMLTAVQDVRNWTFTPRE